MSKKIFIDPSSRILYSSFYIEGLYQVFGKNNVSFSSQYFTDLNRSLNDFSFEHFFAFVVVSDNKIQKFVIDFCDPYDIHENGYDWGDFYAKINLNYRLIEDRFKAKLILIPPGFGIQIWNVWQTGFFCIKNYLFNDSTLKNKFTKHCKDYYHQYKRPRISDFEKDLKTKKKSDKPFIFMIATLWEDQNSIVTTNKNRKEFIEICKQKKCNFEGGFFSKSKPPEYQNLIFDKHYSVNQYIEKTKKSLFVFNTPAVHNCHGWKLAEYIAMGKAIISTKLCNEIPEEFLANDLICFIDNETSLENKIALLLNNSEYCRKLELNTKALYFKKVQPKAVISALMKR